MYLEGIERNRIPEIIIQISMMVYNVYIGRYKSLLCKEFTIVFDYNNNNNKYVIIFKEMDFERNLGEKSIFV